MDHYSDIIRYTILAIVVKNKQNKTEQNRTHENENENETTHCCRHTLPSPKCGCGRHYVHGPKTITTGGGGESVQNGAFNRLPHTKRCLEEQGGAGRAGRDEAREEHREGAEQRHGAPPRGHHVPST